MPLAGPILTRIIIYVAIAALSFGGWKLFMSHVKNQGKQEVVAEVTANALANKATADAESAKRAAEYAASLTALQKKVAALRAEKASACSEVDALPGALEKLK